MNKKTQNKITLLTAILFLTVLLLSSMGCEPDDPCSGEPLSFQSLTVAEDTIEAGAYVDVVAVAEGCRLSYHWSVTAGSILGSGPEVIFAASPCSVGDNVITCTVKDGNDQSETKTVGVVVR
jgi:hypothetical protein